MEIKLNKDATIQIKDLSEKERFHLEMFALLNDACDDGKVFIIQNMSFHHNLALNTQETDSFVVYYSWCLDILNTRDWQKYVSLEFSRQGLGFRTVLGARDYLFSRFPPDKVMNLIKRHNRKTLKKQFRFA